MSATLRPQLPEERILRCSAVRSGVSRKKGYVPRVTCEKPALHGFGCLLSPQQKLQAYGNGAPGSLVAIFQREAHRHAGRDANGKWNFWKES